MLFWAFVTVPPGIISLLHAFAFVHEAPKCSEALRPLVAAAEGIASIPSGSRDLCGARHIAKRPVGAYNNITEPCHIVLQGGACCQDGVKLAGRRTILM